MINLNSYESLKNRLNLHKDLPYTPDWSAAPDFLKLIVEHCLETRPATVLECSSGLTTVMLARCCQLNRHGKVYSLEDGEEYAIKTRKSLDHNTLEKYAAIIHAPLEKTNINGIDYAWYDMKNIPERSIDMLVIDGPSGFIQKNSRYPALPLLFDRLSDHCMIFLDDAARDDEKEIIKFWIKEHPEISHEYIETERGCSILTINKFPRNN